MLRRYLRVGLMGLLLLLGGLSAGYRLARPDPGYRLVQDAGGSIPSEQSQPVSAVPAGGDEFRNLIPDVVAEAEPAVVQIVATIPSSNPFLDNPFFQGLFPGLGESSQESLGSGFIIARDGYILTNDHVVNGASQVMVTVPGHSPVAARIVGTDYGLDLALLKIPGPGPWPTLPLGDSNRIRIGQWGIAIGNPYGLTGTVTLGVISAEGRPLTIGNRNYRDLLQTDAAINPGNSGGPLLNVDGEVVGINTAVASAAQGIGFAIPINTAKDVLQKLLSGENLATPWLGVQVEDLTPSIAAELGLNSGITEGAVVVGVVPGSPAAYAGIAEGDVILAVDDHPVNSASDLAHILDDHYQPGDQVSLAVATPEGFALIPVTLGSEPLG